MNGIQAIVAEYGNPKIIADLLREVAGDVAYDEPGVGVRGDAPLGEALNSLAALVELAGDAGQEIDRLGV